MLIAMQDSDFADLINGTPPRGFRLPDSDLAPTHVLQMLRALAASVAVDFAPSAWMMMEDNEIAGLCSIVGPPVNGQIEIGYGVAATRQGRGITSRALADVLDWARNDSRVESVAAETGLDNIASQIVLARNGFQQIGQRVDAEDGTLICWLASTGR